MKYFVLLFSKHVECLSTIESDCDSWCRTGQSYVNPPRKLPVDNLKNFNERPEKRNEELESVAKLKTKTDSYFRVSKYSELNDMRFKKVNLELAWLCKMSITRPHNVIHMINN